MRIYYLDDSSDDFMLLRAGFKRSGYSVTLIHFLDPDEFKESIVSFPPDLAITDLKMPKISGLEIVKWHFDSKIKTPLIVLSGGRIEAEVREVVRHEVSYMFKPSSLERYSALAFEIMRSFDPLRKRNLPDESSGSQGGVGNHIRHSPDPSGHDTSYHFSIVPLPLECFFRVAR